MSQVIKGISQEELEEEYVEERWGDAVTFPFKPKTQDELFQMLATVVEQFWDTMLGCLNDGYFFHEDLSCPSFKLEYERNGKPKISWDCLLWLKRK